MRCGIRGARGWHSCCLSRAMKTFRILLVLSIVAVTGCVAATEPDAVEQAPGVEQQQLVTATLLSAPPTGALAYTPIVVNPKKLKTSLATALQQFPGEEIVVGSDTNAPLQNARMSFTNAFTYPLEGLLPFPKAPRVDGLQAVPFANFVSPVGTIPGDAAGRVVTVTFPTPVTAFGVNMVAGRTDLVTLDGLDVSVDGVYVGRRPLTAGVISFVGVQASAGMRSVTLTPVRTGIENGAWAANQVFVK